MDYKETIKQMITDGVISQEAVEKYVPELKESEDERIRKWCITHFRVCFRVTTDNIEYKEYINNKVIPWLEKQDEKNLKKEYSYDAIDEALEEWLLKEPRKFDKHDGAYYTPQSLIKMCQYVLSKVSEPEQKPAEWSEEDEKYLNCAIKYCDEVGFEKGHYAVSNWLRTRLKSLRPQK